jgi:hypothetical protein
MQLDQYDAQGMFGDPTVVDSDAAMFCMVWTYMLLKLLTASTKHDALVTALHILIRPESLMRHMLIAWIKQAPGSSILSQQQRTS